MTKDDFENRLCLNKTVRAVYKMKNYLELIARKIGLEHESWTIIHVCTAWNAVREEYLQTFTPNNWINKMKHFRAALEMLEVKSVTVWNKELILYQNAQLKEEIDNSPVPYKKRSANKPPYKVWKQMIEDFDNLDRSLSDTKILRAAQGTLLLNWTLSSGARMDELLRLRKSDVTVVTKGCYSYMHLTVRRGKASRLGRRPTFLKCFENKTEEAFCPLVYFIKYVKELQKLKLFDDDSDLLFPSSAKFKDIPISRKAIVDQWKSTAKKLGIPSELTPQAHSGHALLINTAWVFDQNNEQLLDITNWNSIRNLPEYVEVPKENSINIIKTTMGAAELDKKCAMIF